jgi:RecB family endonuclease NucS
VEGIEGLDVRVVVPESLEDARVHIAEALERRYWITMAALCRAWYEGRGASEATLGDRIVMVKPDGSVIVHGHRGFKPLNWQPETSAITVTVENGMLVLRALRRTPREVLVLECSNVYSILIALNPEEGQFWMYMSEEELRDIIAGNPSIVEEGLRIIDVERPVEPGFVDLYARDRDGNIVVIEVKRVKAGEEAVKQLLSYIEALKARGVRARGILVAPSVTENALKLIHLYNLEFKQVDLRKLYMESAKRRARFRQLTDFIQS